MDKTCRRIAWVYVEVIGAGGSGGERVLGTTRLLDGAFGGLPGYTYPASDFGLVN